jgi:phosphoglucosamine mutase
MSHPRFGTDGVRGVANGELTPDVAVALARAASEVLGGNRVVIGLDTRRSGPMLEAGLVAGYLASGVDVDLLGVVPTPAVAWVSAHDGVPGVMISASHNPFADNGIKLFAPGGLKLSDAVEATIEARFHQLLDGMSATAPPVGAAVGITRRSERSRGWQDAVCASIGHRRFEGVRVVLDCANGSASGVGPEIFSTLGADVVVVGNEPDGININAGCGSTHPELLQAAVVDHGADLGLAFDGDADRLIAVDEVGRIVDGDHVLAMLAHDWSQTGRLAENSVVVTVMSNLGFRRAMASAGINVIETAVGDRYVLEALDQGSFSLGGEQSGHVICRDLATTGDGVLAGVQLLDAVLRSGSSLGGLAGAAMTSMPQVLKNVRLPARDPQIVELLQGEVTAAEDQMGADGRVLVRASGTEPLVRIMVEHLDAVTAERVCDHLVSVTEALVRKGT